MVKPYNYDIPDSSERLLDLPIAFKGLKAETISLDMMSPMVLPFGEVYSRPSGWVELETVISGRSTTGYGEGVTLSRPMFTDDCGDNIADNMHKIGIGMMASSNSAREAVDYLRTYRFADNGIYPTACLAVEMALIDALTKSEDMSVGEFIGLPEDIKDVHYGKSIGSGDEASILSQVEQAIGLKAKKIKLKISPATFSQVVSAIDEIKVRYPDIELMVDANGSFDPLNKVDIESLTLLDNKALMMIEEPVSRVGQVRGLDAVRRLRQVLPEFKTPVCLDDSLRTYEDCQVALNEGLADVINIKPGRIGSFLGSLELIHNAKMLQKQVMVGGMFEATPGRAMTSILGAFCVSRGFNIPGDLSLAQERLSQDIVSKDKQMQMNEDGNIVLPTGPGWGF